MLEEMPIFSPWYCKCIHQNFKSIPNDKQCFNGKNYNPLDDDEILIHHTITYNGYDKNII